MKKFLSIFSKVVLVIVFLNFWSWSIFHVFNGGEKFGPITNSIKAFAQFPKTASEVFKSITDPERLFSIDPNFESINKLDYDVYALNADFDNFKWNIRLVNLRNDSLIHLWQLEENSYVPNERVFSHAEPLGPIVLSDRSVVLNMHLTNNLLRLNSESEVMWQNNDYLFHHGINIDGDGNIWTCTNEKAQLLPQRITYLDDYITQIDVNTGEALFHKSVSEIFFENGLNRFIHGYGNVKGGDDPFHLNEVEPILEDGPNWKKGDLLISLRHRSTILLYRPSTNQILKLIQGDFLMQHDVDILNDSTISMFNNNESCFRKLSECRECHDHSA